MNDKELKLEEIEASHTLGYAGFKEPRVSCVDNLPCIFLRNAFRSSCFAQTKFRKRYHFDAKYAEILEQEHALASQHLVAHEHQLFKLHNSLAQPHLLSVLPGLDSTEHVDKIDTCRSTLGRLLG